MGQPESSEITAAAVQRMRRSIPFHAGGEPEHLARFNGFRRIAECVPHHMKARLRPASRVADETMDDGFSAWSLVENDIARPQVLRRRGHNGENVAGADDGGHARSRCLKADVVTPLEKIGREARELA